MSAAAAGTSDTSAMFDERIDPGRVASFLLATAMHLALFAVLVFGVRWQNRPPEAVQVELWNEPVAVQVTEPKPVAKLEPVPAPVVLKPEPVIPKPEIAEKAPPKPKPEPPKVAARPRDEEAQRQIREQLNREQTSLAVDRERQQIREQLTREASAAQTRDYEAYAGRIKGKIRGNILLPQDLKGNPEAIFDVVQLPTGEVLSVKLRKSSGHAAYDEAVERAVLKSSPLPRPDRPELFQRALELKFRPLD